MGRGEWKTYLIDMAAPITHIILSEKLKSRFKDFSWDKFLIGTSFPDIRYLRVIKREQTHTETSLKELDKQESFKAGFLFHSLVDKVREDFMIKNSIYEIIPNNRASVQALKLFEDELLYNRVADWEKIIPFFEDLLPQELEFPIHQEDIQRWHKMLQKYFLQKPSLETRKLLFKEFQFAEPDIVEIEKSIATMRENYRVSEIINKFYNDSESLY